MYRKKLKAFTLLEMILVLSIIVLVAIFSIPFTFRAVSNQRIESTADDISSQLFSQQQLAYSGDGGVNTGIYFDSNRFVLYEGDSFAASTSSEEYLLDANYSITNINISDASAEIKFSKNTFKPVAPGSIQITDGSVSYQIAINQEGFIDVNRV